MTMCNCEGPGLESMSTKDLVALQSIMEQASLSMGNETAAATLYAIRYELRKRMDRMVETMNPNYHYGSVAYDGNDVS